MKLTMYQIDAFAEKIFEGNPAAVIPLEQWLSDEIMQSLAEENNLAETAFFVPNNDGFDIRWFTPNKEVKLCGHATLASAFVLFTILGYKSDTIEFNSLSGPLSVSKSVSKENELLTLDFPAQSPQTCELPDCILKGLIKGSGIQPVECLKHEDYVVVFNSEEEVASITPDHNYLKQAGLRGIIVTSPSKRYDFIARFFAPSYGIPEDPVTGSAYTQLMPYWSNRLGQSKLHAKQISPRGGELFCELNGDRVLISGKAVKYLEGTIEI